ncbi:sugar 3,4-ketoisomerase [Alteromonas macleodii]|uniref:dTDP-6-deoxy-3,4-keto-hexulose isomerase n=1 Tax=Alteromonas macleodii TaxID=28108 RepID=A0AB36FP91_ALTMA|nr:FdtA/QdtA family cupin domain-containing protein [Alteromonas macleodii]MBT24796.1 WxcM-like domain-containing protein [Paracoccaceae bacterium]OES26856.1 dTDP-6-deoxy-3,4-keto-hexulose isomerase [Alteromonas macleodii]OES27544.1 dTDP-6-deoxy-3,4-keto-hexulose isomerase [Alteromonas macleodii]OES27640.1 dTDP-6-deoxy-3,4-keto-hexulose isomerase [Alteromonas macleodii]OES39769.1 dTDP-6-deoxy-3,4-keto-hexulose isomerase [Alteromonas macleodii]|tara:strand:+ start:84 stop:482 length:399 start_codon:yes stop_codon:yes gene_type:complete
MKIIEFTPLGDSRGSLVALEANKSIPFDIKRVYYIFATNMGVSRGYHAHRNLKQVAVCVTGSCRFILDDGFERQEVVLDSSTKGLLIEGLIWREMHDFTPDCVLMVLASDYYDEDDYIRDYHKFVKEAREQH